MIKPTAPSWSGPTGEGPIIKPLSWMTPPTVIEESDGLIVVRKRAGGTEDRLRQLEAEVRPALGLALVTDPKEAVATPARPAPPTQAKH